MKVVIKKQYTMGTKLLASLAAVTSITLAVSPASATTFIFDSNNVGGNQIVGVHKHILTTFDGNTDLFTWKSTFQVNPNNGKLANGAWLVISEGPNPKDNVQEYTMFYLDGINEKVSLYTYNGVNGSNSWKDANSVYQGDLDLDIDNSVAGERTFNFSHDMTEINSRQDLGNDWKGTFFGSSVGIWFHGVDGLDAAYSGPSGSLSQFSYNSQGWYDTDYLDTEAVPEPGLTLGLSLAGLFATWLRKRG
ncbi:MAG: PEP-CTERM sorting domain-containing protein [Symploca sp. SIO2G7]|nr:PEP-CTERM sorting domain-containing protein [Symploca sp. SIO2G7]